MPQSLSQLYVHLIFSTHNRKSDISDVYREELHKYMCGTLKRMNSPVISINSVEDHVHILFNLSKNYAISKVVEEVKKGTSKWLKEQHSNLKDFSWQRGYGSFSVSQSGVRAVAEYIARQKEHHLCKSFQDEFLEFLEKYEIDYNEDYLWN